ncbi:inorganic diphosphatase [Purpureocillium lilacinum]|uniref:inorganic diphosphatase n=1 Tax=Purpureocillium lilacinum TaxID=33203 RepID=A0A179HRS4_PURLI|nr:inorganic diphosphatase [Purpureocillium lilacinum]OAQ92140.1 inorganic diphosphatase [Purpureocillium lilacinum]
MLSVTSLAWLAIAPCSILGASITPRDGSDFDVKSLSLREVGARNTLDWRMWLEKDGNPISFWHDIPLYPNKTDDSIVHFYVEIPRWTDAKIETKRDEPLNPIFHDDKKKKPRFVASVWPHRSYPFLYGSFPQTWENSNVKHNISGLPGDNDPMDVFDISGLDPGYVGQVRKVKVLGGLAMIDDGTTDWKAIVINVDDPLSKVVNSVEDLEKYRPGLKKQFYDWFTYYKVVKGDGLNTIVGKDYKDAAYMREAIAESHGFWQDLILGKEKHDKISTRQTSNPRACKSYIPSKNATKEFDIPEKSNVLPPAAKPKQYDYWYYLDKDFNVIPGQVIDVQ